MLPLSTVEKPSFKNMLLNHARGNDIQVINRRRLKQEITEMKKNKVQSLKDLFEKQAYLCTTADIWSTRNKSYLGMTAHFIDNEYTRQSFILACQRIRFKHTYDVIAKEIYEIHNRYSIVSKVTHTVTDNASNFMKAFKIFHSDGVSDKVNIDNVNIDKDNDLDDVSSDEEVMFDNKFQEKISDFRVIDSDSESDKDDVILPQQIKCFSHSLNLLATTDALKATDNASYKKNYYSAFSKASALWNALSRSTYASDEAEEICKSKFKIPNKTRWNAYYDAVKKILEKKTDINNLMEKLSIAKFKTSDILFFEEYIQVMQPVANALDLLQTENNMYLGFVLPTLLIIQHKLEVQNLNYCRNLRLVLLEGIQSRFGYILNFKNSECKTYLLASISHPKFKLGWLSKSDDGSKQFCIDCFVSEAEKFLNGNVSDSDTSRTSSDEFFSMFKSPVESAGTQNTISNKVKVQCLSYLDNKEKNLTMLNMYPVVKEMFYKYNTTLPSSAPVERMFSVGGQIMTPRRNRLSDEMFEMLLFLKGNT